MLIVLWRRLGYSGKKCKQKPNILDFNRKNLKLSFLSWSFNAQSSNDNHSIATVLIHNSIYCDWNALASINKHVKKLEHNVRSLESLVKFLKERYKFRHSKNMSHSGISHKADNMHQAGHLHDQTNKSLLMKWRMHQREKPNGVHWCN